MAASVSLLVICAVLAICQVTDGQGGYYPQDTLDLQTLSNGKRYLVSNNQIPWFDAMTFCRSYGLDLVQFETQAENDMIRDYIGNSTGMRDWFWTGGHRIGRASWGWLTSATMPFSNWGPGQPNDTISYGTLECMFTRQGQWYAEFCVLAYSWFYERGGFVCEEN